MSSPQDSTTTGRRATAGRSVVLDQPVGSTRTLERLKENGLVTSRVRRTVLPGGLRVITEEMSGVRSVAIGVWVGVGSRDESPTLHGCSHFLEHLLFQGTTERSSVEISETFDELGGDANAFTAKEYTCFHARVLDIDAPVAIDVLGDMITSSLLTDDAVEAERSVILDEIAMHDDDPDDALHNILANQAWGDTGLGRPIAGTVESISALTAAQIRRFYRRHYQADNLVISVAGNVEHTQVVRWVKRAFSRQGFLSAQSSPAPRRIGRKRKARGAVVHQSRDLEQVNLVLGFDGPVRTDPRRYVLSVLNAVLGGGASSRLFQEVRERRGLAYGIYTFASHHDNAGLVGVAVGCLPDKVSEVLATVREELARLIAEPITAAELTRAKRQLVGGLVLGMEDSSARMSRLGKADLLFGELMPVTGTVHHLEAVTAEQVTELAREIFSQAELLVSIGPT